MMAARCSRSAGQVIGKQYFATSIGLDAERVLNDLGGLIGVVAVDRLRTIANEVKHRQANGIDDNGLAID
jgi:hypothetical protein